MTVRLHSAPSVPAYDAAAERETNAVGRAILQARKEAGLTLRAFSERLACSGVRIQSAGISKWENGTVIPNAYQLLAICHALDLEDPLTVFSENPARMPELSEEGLRKLREYRADLIATGNYTPAVPVSRIDYIRMPVSRLAASAGTGEFLSEEAFEDLRVPKNSVPAGAEFGIRVSGDSMEPVYSDGQIVWVKPCTRLKPGEVGIFLLAGEGFLKLYDEQEPPETERELFTDSTGSVYRQPVLISYNEHYAPRPVSPHADFRIVGRVLN